jgi:predicted nucleic acid-binding protein
MLRDGKADILVTGDKALLFLGSFEGAPIVSPATFVGEYLAPLESSAASDDSVS